MRRVCGWTAGSTNIVADVANKPVVWPREDLRLRTHEGYEWLHVLSGRLCRHLGAQVVVLEPGEVVEFDTCTPHALANLGPPPVETLCLFGPYGDRVHVRSGAS